MMIPDLPSGVWIAYGVFFSCLLLFGLCLFVVRLRLRRALRAAERGPS